MTLRDQHFNQATKLHIRAPRYRAQVTRFLGETLADDIRGGDITSRALIQKSDRRTAHIRAKESGILAGMQEILWLIRPFDISVQKHMEDGEAVRPGSIIAVLHGNTRDLLAVERTILNALQRMSGIATATHAIASKLPQHTLLCPTRKTQWGWLDKRAVTLGGGGTHRLHLSDFVLIKDTHMTLASDRLEAGLKKIRDKKYFWEIEVESPEQARWAAAQHPHVIMFDNMTPAQIRPLIQELRNTSRRLLFEASGGITARTATAYARAGVDVISLGSLTHSSRALDIHMKLI